MIDKFNMYIYTLCEFFKYVTNQSPFQFWCLLHKNKR